MAASLLRARSRRLRLLSRFLGAGAVALLAFASAAPAFGQITTVGTSSQTQSGTVTSVVLTPPPGTAAGDVIIAHLAIRRGTSASITLPEPPGWTLANRTNSGTTMAQLVYWRVATASEPADYTWNFTPSDRAAGIATTFRAVLASNPVDVVAGTAFTSSTTPFTAPSVTTTVANTMLVAMYSIDAGNRSFSTPAGMTELADIASGPPPSSGITASMAVASFVGPGATGGYAATPSSAGLGVATLLALRPDPDYVYIGGFNAFDTSTAAGAISGVIRTKIAGASFNLALVALNAARTAVATSFTGSVTVELLDSSNNTGALNAATGCRSTWTSIQTVSPNPIFASGDNGRINASFTSANAWRDVRVRITYTSGATTVIGCSNDNFAIRPDRFINLRASDLNDGSTGTTRALDNAVAASGVVHRAGRAFTVRADAVSATSSVTSGYSGTPTLVVASCTLPVGCAAGALTPALTGATGTVTGTATYAEAGVISVHIEDSSFAAVDAADSTLAERTIRSSTPATFGRFVPDNYRLTVATTPQFAPPLCGAGPARQAFTYVGQPFAFGTVPVVLATPLNAAGAALANARPRFATTHLAYPVAAAGAPAALSGTTTVAGIAHSATSLITFNAGSFTFSRGTNPIPSFTPTLTMTVNLADTTENTVIGNSTINAASALTISPIAFAASASTFHYGRVQLRPVYGDVRRELYLPLEVQRYNGLGWIALPEAGACLAAPASSFAYSNATGLLTSGAGAPNCASRVATIVTTSSGRAAVRLDKPGNVTTAAPSAMTVTLNLLAAATGTSCSGATPSPATTVNAPWLANPDGSNPAARVTWGRQRGELLGLRERFD